MKKPTLNLYCKDQNELSSFLERFYNKKFEKYKNFYYNINIRKSKGENKWDLDKIFVETWLKEVINMRLEALMIYSNQQNPLTIAPPLIFMSKKKKKGKEKRKRGMIKMVGLIFGVGTKKLFFKARNMTLKK